MNEKAYECHLIESMVGITTGEEWMKAECEGENETWVEIKSEGIIDNLITLRLMSPRGDIWKKRGWYTQMETGEEKRS